MRKIIRRSPFPPVVVAHSLGALVAQKAAEAEPLSALVLLCPPLPKQLQPALPRSLRRARLKYLLLMALGRPFRLEDDDFRRLWFNALSEAEQGHLLRRMIAESGHLIRDFFERDIELRFDRITCPALVMGGSDDAVVPVSALRDLARLLRGDLKVCPGHGHWILGEGGGEAMVRDIHRWVVQRLGGEIVLAEFAGDQ